MLTHSFLKQNKSGLLHLICKYYGSLAEAMKVVDINYVGIKQQNTIRKWSPKK